MRMTKTIREYINSQVEYRVKKAHEEQLAKLEAEADAERANWEKSIDDFEEKINNELTSLLRAYNYAFSENCYHSPTAKVVNVLQGCLPCQKAYTAFLSELNKKIFELSRDIAVSMELGGTKKELVELLDEIK